MNAAIAPDPWEGRVVEGKYPLLEMLGSGAHGPVFRTRLPNQQAAAIKLIPVTNADQQLTKLRAASQLSHPNLLKIIDFGACQIRGSNNVFVVTEFADENLAQVVPGRALTSEEARQMLIPLLDALAYLHANGFIHGRVQPSNILAVGDTLKLSTDSLYRAGDQPVSTKPDRFSPPETSSGVLTPVADVWSLGATLVTALRPSGQGNSSVVHVPESIPEPFRKIATASLKANPADRCTIAEVKSWMQPQQQSPRPPSVAPVQTQTKIAAAEPVRPEAPRLRETPRPQEPPQQETPRAQSFGKLALVIGIVLLLVVFGLWKWIRSSGPNPADRSAAESASTSQPGSTPVQSGNTPSSVVDRAMPNVSQNALHTIHGKIKVAVRVNVNEQGQVTDAKLTTAGSSKYFANKALEAARAWKFQPSVVDGQAKPSTWTLKYQFANNGVDVSPLLVQ